MPEPLTPRALAKIAAFAGCRTQASPPNMEQARQYLGTLLNAYEDQVALNNRLLPVREMELARSGNELEFDTCEATRRRNELLLEAIREGRGR
jgi:hypothetical protein